jgi:hypothetical protein
MRVLAASRDGRPCWFLLYIAGGVMDFETTVEAAAAAAVVVMVSADV